MHNLKRRADNKEFQVKALAYYVDPKRKQGSILNGQEVIASYENVINAMDLEFALHRDFLVTIVEPEVPIVAEEKEMSTSEATA